MTPVTRMALRFVAMAAAAACLGGAALAAPASELPRKKLIEYGWDVPTPDFVRQNIRAMEEKPFDGLIFHMNAFDHAFDPTTWDDRAFDAQVRDLMGIRWQRFTDNFLMLYAANKWDMDWFNDAQWAAIEANLRRVSRAARDARCVGICFDPEPYGTNPWAFETARKGHSYAETCAAVRRRGAAFARALQSALPGMRLLTFYHLSMFRDVAMMPTAADREAFFTQPGRKTRWGLIVPFVNGWLDASTPRTVIIDGNEHSYYHTTGEQFYRDYYTIHQQMLALVPPPLRPAYRERVQAGMALYMDELVSLREARDNPVGSSLSPADRLLWLEHNTYMALRCADEYVWCYSEKMDWWRNRIPEGAEATIRRAREKCAAGRSLGFSIGDVMARQGK